MPLTARPSKGYWGCETLTNQALWVLVIACVVTGVTLIGQGVYIKDGPRFCYNNAANCVGNFSAAVCSVTYSCNVSYLANGTCPYPLKGVWCENEPRADMNQYLGAGIAILVIGVLPALSFFFSKAPVDPNADYEDKEAVYIEVAHAVNHQLKPSASTSHPSTVPLIR